MPSARRALALLSLVALPAALASPAARGQQGKTSSLGWVRLAGAEGCVGPRPLAEAVERKLRRPVFVSPAQAEVSVEGRIERLPDGSFRATMVVSDARGAPLGARELTAPGPDCSAIDEQLTLVIALLIDPSAALASPPASSPAAPPASSPPASPPPAPSAPAAPASSSAPAAPAAREPAPPRPWRWEAALGGVLGLGLLPSLGAGAQLRAQARPPRFVAIELSGAIWADQDALVNDAKGLSLELSQLGLSLCPAETASGRLRLSGCAGVQVGALRARGQGLAVRERAESTLVNLAAQARLALTLAPPLQLAAGLGLALPLRRDRFFYLDELGREQDLFRPSFLALTADLGVGVFFP